MLSGLENREALEAVLKEDVYYAHGMADYEVHAFKAGKSPGILLRTRVNKMALNDCLK